MDLQKCWKITWLIIVSHIIFLNPLEGSKSYDPESLEAFVVERANKEIPKPRTGTLYNIPLPSNFSDIKFSVIRLRSGSLRSRGVNITRFFNLPPWIKPEPYVERMAIVYENLGNLSSRYYNVPNHSIIAPVLGLMAYNSSGTTLIESTRLKLSILGGREGQTSIKVRFFQGGVHGKKGKVPICAVFGGGGMVELKNTSKSESEGYVCEAEKEGHYSLVVPLLEEEAEKVERRRKFWGRRWNLGLGIGSGVIGMGLVGLVIVGFVMALKRRKMREMEEKAEKGEAFGVFWVGESKMPCASMIRTQPTLEN
ncbi:plant/F17O14-7 protein [Senna tora]|uniref:Plant/F17O14-7 protein n=1 Tax=Senna tora TaxID=362788 RepID=A0A834WK19_9FABA|nr:plant/F17O14-7 protein [Senna tora]